jgi:group I intron endonuclease
MNECNYYVYELIDPRNNLPFYVGKGTILDNKNRRYRRIYDHLNLRDKSNRFKNRVINKIRKHGLEVKFNIIQEFTCESEAFALEITLIKKHGKRIDNSGILTNLTDGGEGVSGNLVSEKTKQLMSIRAKERLEKYGVNFKGKHHLEENKRKFSESRRGKNCGQKNPMFGKKHTLESKQKMADKQKGHSNLPRELWYKFGSHRDKNPQAKKYFFINPDNKIFEVNGNFKGFIKENGLSYDICREFINKGKIPFPINPNHNLSLIHI